MLNSATIMGRLTADPELRVATTGREVCRFTVAVDRPGGDRVADFIRVICFGSTANFVEKHFRKGSMIALQGRIQTGSYTDSKGAKRYTFEVVAVEVSFCGERRGDNPSTASGPPFPPETGTLLSATQTFPLTGESPFRTVKADEGVNGYYSTAVPGDFDEIVGDEE